MTPHDRGGRSEHRPASTPAVRAPLAGFETALVVTLYGAYELARGLGFVVGRRRRSGRSTASGTRLRNARWRGVLRSLGSLATSSTHRSKVTTDIYGHWERAERKLQAAKMEGAFPV